MPVVDTWHKTVKLPDGSLRREKSASYGRGKRWAARYRDDRGQQKSPKFKTKPEAERHLKRVEGELLRGTYVDPAAGKVTLREFADRWREDVLHRPLTASRVLGELENHIYPEFGHRGLSSILPSDVQRWVTRLGKSLAPATVESIYATLRGVFEAAVRDDLLTKTPCRGIRLPEKRKTAEPVMPVETLREVVDGVPERFKAVVLLAAGSGLRQGELFGLELHHLDVEHLVLRVEQQLVTPVDNVAYLAQPKSPASYRDIPLTRETADMMLVHLDSFPAGPVEIEDRTDPHKPRRRTAHLLFTLPNGGPVRRWEWNRILTPAMAKAGMPKRSGLHSVRRFYASLLIRYGESVKTVQTRMGHSSAAITLDVYAGLWPDSEDRTREAVASGLGNLHSVRPVCADDSD
ncbi:tyrosine-type recombinase/integrase [Nocardiopsis dassonvillei]|uniref:Integrase family protein n=1 Tax=Nocardiopsis dassonvillei (strain ATCC 23218 / DSM 43111 / CIP 107115 / JCM 7437 / KCTC 9190 / NBRC 14626 / NCTC 10488 / NRRL B-5397 / IMRU 509) TaxID=446468 RepID=D7AXH7_NOCDD|nr:tyrosine-type recombinase/integrase [Nocardiopsis dassonvillei]ADH66051.1 integrase family protein [Nocardiopsis dassonvillei subsp. dassonvillei DSM 43111]NKY81178.1 site-specific integrase [Nocardiopsis dassonvillei]VEI92072.1 Integrase [Nocardiopsis dassonvillei]